MPLVHAVNQTGESFRICSACAKSRHLNEFGPGLGGDRARICCHCVDDLSSLYGKRRRIVMPARAASVPMMRPRRWFETVEAMTK